MSQDADAGGPQLSPRTRALSPTNSPSSATVLGELWSYFYNGKASVAGVFSSESKLADDVEAWVLGRSHKGEKTTEWVQKKVQCVSYFTYRNRIPSPLAGAKDHDAGWGCMIRTGQMMFLEALLRVHEGLTVQKRKTQTDGSAKPLSAAAERYVDEGRLARQWFMDLPDAPFGLHALVEAGARYHIPVGQWFNPTCLSHSLAALAERSPQTSDVLRVVIARDGVLSRSEVCDTLCGLDRAAGPRAVLCLLPLRLGPEGTMAKQFHESFLRCLELPNTVGIVGGRPKMSLYFIGHQLDDVFFLDPHVVQPAYVSAETEGNVIGPRGTAKVSAVDSSLLLCFVFHAHADFLLWEERFKRDIDPLTEYPLFVVGEHAIPATDVDDFALSGSDAEEEPAGTTPPTTAG